VCAHRLSHVLLFVTPRTVACQASLSMKFSRQEYWNGLQFSLLGDLSNPEIEPKSPVSSALTGGFFTTVPPGKPINEPVNKTNISNFFQFSSSMGLKWGSITKYLYPWGTKELNRAVSQ